MCEMLTTYSDWTATVGIGVAGGILLFVTHLAWHRWRYGNWWL